MKKVLAMTVLSVFLPASVFALDVSVNSNTSLNVGAGVSGNVQTDVETKAEATTSEVVVGIPGSVEVVVITRADVGKAEVRASASPETVSADADISGYVAAQMAADTNVSKMESSKTRVSVTYPQRAMLFGFMPITVDATATVLADGTVDVRYPWYAFLMVTNEADLESEIEGRVSTLPSPSLTASAEASLELSARAQAELIDTIRAAMENTLVAEAAAAASI
ncbi:hypothetical protein HY417_03695 [Candidatus Kaiserbacteria bacterium]|nr:hypothetical protein [Candidatus Kaiserbacteria bacterium]